MRDSLGAKLIPDEPEQGVRRRSPRSRAAKLVVGLAAALLMVATIGSTVASADPSADDWLRLRQCESGNNYAINTGNGYYGAYQFDASTWRSVGGTGLPHQASPETQDALALKLWQQRGWAPWACARILGLSGGGGSSSAPVPPKGVFDAVQVTGRNANVYGWAVDPNSSSASIQVHVYVNSAGYAFNADKDRPDVNGALSISGRHGFAETIQLQPGSNKICAFAIGQANNNNTLLDCKTVQGPAWPVGWVDTMAVSGWNVTASGWTFDPNSSGTSTAVHLYINGAFANGTVADRSRPDVNSAFGIGGQHGFAVTGRLRAGPNSVCAFGIGLASYNNVQLPCQTINGPVPPVGYVDLLAVSGQQASVGGWAFDPNNPGASIPVHVYVNGNGAAYTANKSRGDVNGAFGIGGQHGFSETVQLQNGANSICVFAIGQADNNNTLLSCRDVQSAQSAQQRLSVPDAGPEAADVATDSLGVENQPPADGVESAASAVAREAVTAAPPGPSTSGPTTTVPTSTGPTTTVPATTVPTTTEPPASGPTTGASTSGESTTQTSPALESTAVASTQTTNPTATSTTAAPANSSATLPLNPFTGSSPSTVVITPALPPIAKGALEHLEITAQTGILTGWIADPTAGPAGTRVRITVNGATHDVLANAPRPEVGQAAGSPVPWGFVDSVTLARGTNEICLYELDRDSAIVTAPVACRTENVA